jgi:uncharacterized membrane protein
MSKKFFTDAQQKDIIQAIKQAEKDTSGEIQVHLESQCKKEVMVRAQEVFTSLDMSKTALKNGVLFYLAVVDQKFAILGDEGINKVVPPNFWDEIKNAMQARFKAGQFCEGLCEGIIAAGQQLKQHFPYGADDKNELSDEISFGKEDK